MLTVLLLQLTEDKHASFCIFYNFSITKLLKNIVYKIPLGCKGSINSSTSKYFVYYTTVIPCIVSTIP